MSSLGFGVEYGVHNHSSKNVLRGLVERVFRVVKNGHLVSPPKPTARVFENLGLFKSRLLAVLGSCRPWSIEQFVQSYTGAKRLRVEKAAASVSHRPITKMDARLSTFVKAEKLNLSAKPDPAPRVIQPRDPRYNVCVGPYLKAHEHHVYDAIAEVWGGPTVMKGYNSVEVARELRSMWDGFSDPVCVGLDASRFDQHVSRDALEWEHGVYNSMFHCPKLKQWLSWQIDNQGIARVPEATIKYQVQGCRMSGDMNTALGNCLLMTAMVWEYVRERGIPARLGNNGDDCVVIMSRRHLSKFTQGLRDWFLTYGFDMKVEAPVDVFERVEFCQTRPVWNGEEWVMTRDLRTVFTKDAVCLHTKTNPYGRWLSHVGEGGGALCAGIPVMQQYYTILRELGNGGKYTGELTGMDYMGKRLKCREVPISDEARVSFYKAFGINPYQQVALESELRFRSKSVTMDLKFGIQPTSCDHILNILDGW